MTGSVTGIRRRRGVAGRRETPHLPLDRDFYGQTLNNIVFAVAPCSSSPDYASILIVDEGKEVFNIILNQVELFALFVIARNHISYIVCYIREARGIDNRVS